MPKSLKHMARAQFGAHSDAYVVSEVHSQGRSLQRLVELSEAHRDWKLLDIATGGGHTAKAFANMVAQVTAVDLSRRMLSAARQQFSADSLSNIAMCQTDSENLCFGDNSFDCVSCRIAAHHFPDITAWLRQCNRVLIPNGILALADNVIAGEPEVAVFVNLFEKFRDPSHHWAYSVDDWRTLLAQSAFEIRHLETYDKMIDFEDWAERLGVIGDDRVRLSALLQRSPANAEAWLKPSLNKNRLTFTIREMIVIARKI